MKGIVLAGGKSRRFGEDKAFALCEGVPMIQKIVSLLEELDLDPCVITNSSQDYSFLNCEVLKDLIPDKGPLGGIYTAFSSFEDLTLLVLTCDMPFLSKEALRFLCAQHSSENKATVFRRENGSFQPFPGIYEPSLQGLVEANIGRKILSMQAFIAKTSAQTLLIENLDPHDFANINSKKELKEYS